MMLRFPLYIPGIPTILLTLAIFFAFTSFTESEPISVLYAQTFDNSIRGRVWEDLDNDGIQDADELGIPGVTVNLLDLLDNLQTTVTDADGFYAFDDLAPDTYDIQVIRPTGWVVVAQAQGSDSTLDSDIDPATGTEGVVFATEGNHQVYDAGLYLMPTPTPTETETVTPTPTETTPPTETPTPTASYTLPAPPSFPTRTFTPTLTDEPIAAPTETSTATPTETSTATPIDAPTATTTATLAPGAFSCEIVTEIPLNECKALVALYNSTDGPNWIDNAGWLNTHTPCQWYGVLCENGVVAVLDFGPNGLVGELPTELGDLTSLHTLIIDSNQLEGALPDSMINMAALQSVNLDYNAVWTDNADLIASLESSAPGWVDTQTLPPKNLQAIADGPTQITLFWEPVGLVAAGGYYEISYTTSTGEQFTVSPIIGDRMINSYTISDLAPGTGYDFQIRSVTPAHDSQVAELVAYSEGISVQTAQLMGCEFGQPAEGEICVDLSDVNVEVALTEDGFLNIKLPVIPSNGSFWYVANGGSGQDESGAPVLRPMDQPLFYAPEQAIPILGRAAIQIFRFDPTAPGKSQISLEYRNPRDEVIDTYTVFVNNEGTFDNVQPPSAPPADDSLPPLNPPGTPGGGFTSRSMRSVSALPAAFSWCNHPDGKDYCPPIQDQGECGSCWAFTTVGAMETLINIKDGTGRDLSEQHLLSCNNEDIGNGRRWSCSNGGWYAFDYYTDKLSSPHNSGPGTVWELDFVYTEGDIACKAGLPHHEQLSSWSYINPKDPFSMSYVDEIKEAIAEYGPVVTSLCVGPSTKEYRGGILDTNEGHLCEQYGVDTNHAVILVGWDDSEDVWIMRNSWNTWWGEEGYARIKYGTSNIGFAAAYAIYEGSVVEGPNAPSTLDVQSEVTSDGYQMNLSWQDESDDEASFQIFRSQGGSWTLQQEISADQTIYQDRAVECNQEYSYRIKAVNAEGESGYSNTIKTIATCADLSPPASFTATTGDSGITLEWENENSFQDGVLVLRWNWETEAWDEFAVIEGLATSFEDNSELEPGQTYAYILRAVTDGRYSAPTDYQSAAAPMVQLSGPTQARAEVVTEETIRVVWQDNSDTEDGYVIARYNAALDIWEELATLDPDATEYVDNSLSCAEQKQYYQIVAFKGDTLSALSNQASEEICAKTEDTSAPISTATIIATATATVIPTAIATSTEMPTTIPTATPTPIVVPTATLMATAVPTEIVAVTSSVTPTDIPTATATPMPSATPVPAIIVTVIPTIRGDNGSDEDITTDVFLPLILR